MKTCSVESCGKPLRAKGLCSTHYNQQHQANRHRKVTVQCGWCGVECEKDSTRGNRYSKLFCTLTCRDAWRKAEGVALGRPDWTRNNSCPIPPDHPSRWADTYCAIAYSECKVCALVFPHDARVKRTACSASCRERDRYTRRQGRHRIRRRDIFERDKWMCHVCHQRVAWTKVVPHPRAPTIDHLVPRVDGIDHDPSNLATSHFVCNSRRSNKGGGEQLALVG